MHLHQLVSFQIHTFLLQEISNCTVLPTDSNYQQCHTISQRFLSTVDPNLKRYSTNPQKEGQGLFAQFFDDTREMKVAFTHYSFHSKSSLNIQHYNKLLHLRGEGSKHHLLQGQNLACRISNCVWPADSCETKVKQQLFMYIKFIKCTPNDFL